MPTADRKISIYSKRLLSLTAIKDNFLDFLKETIDEVAAGVFQANSGVLDADTIGLGVGGTNSQFTLDLANAFRVIVGTGEIINLSRITGAGITVNVPYENDGSSDYYVGIKYAEVEDGIELNSRTGDPEYPSLKQSYGEGDTPDLVTDNTTYIRVRINSITESGVDHTGRNVKVWLVDPVSGVESVAFFTGTSAYSAPNNYVDIPYSGAAGPLGQDTTSNPPSTTPSDYKVFIEGASWKKNTDLRTDSDYAFIGIITSTGGVPTFDISDQFSIFAISLDAAYDGATGAGGGRIIVLDSGAMERRVPVAGTGDDQQYADRIDVFDGVDHDGGLEVVMRAGAVTERSGGGLAVFKPMKEPADDLRATEAVTLGSSTNRVTFTRGAVDLTDANVRDRSDYCLLSGFSPASINKLYKIVARTTSYVDVEELDGTVPSFSSEVGNAHLLRPMLMSVDQEYDAASTSPVVNRSLFVMGSNDPVNDATAGVPVVSQIIGGDGGGLGAILLACTEDFADESVLIYDDGTIEFGSVCRNIAGSTGKFETANGMDMTFGPGVVDGLDMDASSRTAGSEVPSTVRDLMGRWENYNGHPFFGISSVGRIAEPSLFKDDFPWHSTMMVIASTSIPHYRQLGGGGTAESITGNVQVTGGSTAAPGGGYIRLQSGTTAANLVRLIGPEMLRTHLPSGGSANRWAYFYARLAPGATGARIIRVGIVQNAESAFNHFVGLRVDYNTSNNWFFHHEDNATVRDSVDTTIAAGPGSGVVEADFQEVFLALDPDTAGTGLGPCWYWVTGMAGLVSRTLTTTVTTGNFSPILEVEGDGTNQEVWLDKWSIWNDDLK
jgi:hypothetical protein